MLFKEQVLFRVDFLPVTSDSRFFFAFLSFAESFVFEQQTLFGIDLRRSAANDKIFKLFFLRPFLASTIYNNTIKSKFDIG